MHRKKEVENEEEKKRSRGGRGVEIVKEKDRQTDRDW